MKSLKGKSYEMKKIIAIIPARYQSSRFPGKPLAMIAGKMMIERVYERVSEVSKIEDVLVATDDIRIFNAVTAFGGKTVMTGECSCGTERVYEAVKDVVCDIVLNVQGDEPLIQKEMIEDLLVSFADDDVCMATLKKRITVREDIDNPNIVKVIADRNNNALYFSRCPIPYDRDGVDATYYKHIGIYGYTKDFLKEYIQIEKTSLEMAENLEQLRVLESGYKIKVKETIYDSIGVDTPEDILKIEKEIKNA